MNFCKLLFVSPREFFILCVVYIVNAVPIVFYREVFLEPHCLSTCLALENPVVYEKLVSIFQAVLVISFGNFLK